MTLYVLDTDTLRLFQDGHPQVIARVRALVPVRAGLAAADAGRVAPA